MIKKIIGLGCGGVALLIVLGGVVAVLFPNRSSNDAARKPIAPPSPPAAAAPATPTPPPQKWKFFADKSAMDSSTGGQLQLEAENRIETWLSHERPTLIVRCEEHKTEVFIRTETAARPELGLYNQAHVRLRFDEGAPERQTWGESTDNKALFAPSAVLLAKRLTRASRFRFEFTPFNQSPQVVEFDVRGLTPQLASVSKPCGWTP